MVARELATVAVAVLVGFAAQGGAQALFVGGFEEAPLVAWSDLVAPCEVPPDAGPADVSSPTTVVGDGTPAGCTSAAFVAAVAQGGVITFDCGPDPVTITLEQTAKVFNDHTGDIGIDRSVITGNTGGSWYPTYPQISNHSDTPVAVSTSIIRAEALRE